MTEKKICFNLVRSIDTYQVRKKEKYEKKRINVLFNVVTPHAHALAGGYVIGAGVHIYVGTVGRYICLWTKKGLNRNLAIDSPFQTFAVGLLVEFID